MFGIHIRVKIAHGLNIFRDSLGLMLGIDVVGNCRIEQYGEAHEKDDDEDYSG
jgi:hypothetical protein